MHWVRVLKSPFYMYRFLIMYMVFSFNCCIPNSPKKCFVLHDKSTEDKYDKVLWNSSDDLSQVRIMYTKPQFITDVPGKWLALLYKDIKTKKMIHYYLFNAGHTFSIQGDYLFAYKNGFSEQNSFEGWYKKNNEGEFVVIDDDTQLIFQNNLLYKQESNDFLKVHNKKFKYTNEYQTITDDLDYREYGVYELKENDLKKVSNNSSDIFELKSGVFYIPKPGSQANFIVNLNELTNEILETVNSNKPYPKKICKNIIPSM